MVELTTSRMTPFLPIDPGVLAHCKRVAFLTKLVCSPFELESNLLRAIDDAALGHHSFVLKLGEDGFSRLQKDLGVTCSRGQLQPSENMKEIVAIIRGRPFGPSDNWRMGYEILDACNCLDESIELSPYDRVSINEVLRTFGSSRCSVFHEFVGLVLRNQWMRFDGRAALLHIGQLPVVPRSARRLLASSEQDVGVAELESIAKTDPVLAASLLSSANSALYARASESKDIRDAILFLGVVASRKVLLRACFQSLFASTGLQRLWKHATRSAEIAQQLALASGIADPAEAYLSGLVHDIGRLVIERFPQAPRKMEMELRENGFPGVYAEAVAYRQDHAQLGAELLRAWRFPHSVIQAIEYHHRPEANDSVMAALLYLTEALGSLEIAGCDGFEDLPCLMRLNRAEDITGVSMDEAYDMALTVRESRAAA